jgi:hypothetical protein
MVTGNTDLPNEQQKQSSSTVPFSNHGSGKHLSTPTSPRALNNHTSAHHYSCISFPSVTMAAGGIQAPPDLTEKLIKDAKGVNRLSELAQQFNPPVSTENCITVTEKRERLLCAFRKANNLSKDLESVGSIPSVTESNFPHEYLNQTFHQSLNPYFNYM